MQFQLGYEKTASKSWFVQWRHVAGTWAELPQSRTNLKWEAQQFVQLAMQVATLFATVPA